MQERSTKILRLLRKYVHQNRTDMERINTVRTNDNIDRMMNRLITWEAQFRIRRAYFWNTLAIPRNQVSTVYYISETQGSTQTNLLD